MHAELDLEKNMWFLCFCHTPSLHLRVDDLSIDVFLSLLIAWHYASDWLLVLMARFRLFNLPPSQSCEGLYLCCWELCALVPLWPWLTQRWEMDAPAHRHTDTSQIQFQHLAAPFVKGVWQCQHWILCAAALSRLSRCCNTIAGSWALGRSQERLPKDDSWNVSLGTPYFGKSRRWDCLDCLYNQGLADPLGIVL